MGKATESATLAVAAVAPAACDDALEAIALAWLEALETIDPVAVIPLAIFEATLLCIAVILDEIEA